MKRLRTFLLAVLVFGVGYGATTVVAQVGAVLYKNPATGQAFPQQISAGYLATADGGTVNVMNSPAPTAVGQALRSTTTGTAASASWTSDPDGGVYSGGGTAGYIPEWTEPHKLGNSTLWESGASIYRQIAGASNTLYLDDYSASGVYSILQLRKSHNNTIGGLTTTINAETLSSIFFQGVNTTPAWAYGAVIAAGQVGTAGAYVPTRLRLYTFSATGANADQLDLNANGSVTASGAFSAASYPTIGIAFKSTDSSIGITTNTNTTANVDLRTGTNVPRYVGSGTADPSQSPGVAGTVLSFYYQTVHSTDAGTAYGLWWKSGAGDTQWTELASGSGGGSSSLALSSPNNTIAVGVGGGLTTVDVNYGTSANTAAQGNDSRITGAEQAANKGAVGGYCPLDGSALVPVANLPAGTESVAGTMSGPDKTKLDGITAGATPDSYEVAAAYGTTPGYLAAVCESTDGSITIGQTGDYVTFAANFGAGAAQVCSGATCAAKQATLPAGTNGQALVYSASGTGTTTNVQPKSLGESDIASLTTDLASKVPATAQIASGDGLQGGGAIGTGTGRTLAVDTSVLRITSTAFVHTTSINVAGGVAGLNTSGQVATANLPTHLSGDVAATSAGLSVGTGLTIGGALGTGTGAALGVDTGFVRTTSIGVTVEPNLTGPSGDFACYGGTATGTATATLVPCPAPTSTVTSTGVGLGTSARIGVVTTTGTASSTASQAMPSDAKVAINQANGVAGLGTDAKVGWNYLPIGDSSHYGIMEMSTATPHQDGTATPGYSGYPADGAHVHPLPPNQVSIFHSTTLATTMAVGDYPTWHSVLSFATGGAAGSITIQSTVTVKCLYGGGIAYASLWIDNSMIAGQYLATVPVGTGTYGYATLSPVGFAPLSAGGHTIGLDVYSDTTSCVVQGNDQITGGSAALMATEYTN